MLGYLNAAAVLQKYRAMLEECCNTAQPGVDTGLQQELTVRHMSRLLKSNDLITEICSCSPLLTGWYRGATDGVAYRLFKKSNLHGTSAAY
jgi:hypothetical protein